MSCSPPILKKRKRESSPSSFDDDDDDSVSGGSQQQHPAGIRYEGYLIPEGIDVSELTWVHDPTLSEQQKRRKARALRNRQSAQASRNKKKNYVQELEQQIAELKEENERLRQHRSTPPPPPASLSMPADGNTVNPSRIQQSSTIGVDQLMLENIQLRAQVDGLEGVVKSLVGLLGVGGPASSVGSPTQASSPTAISDALATTPPAHHHHQHHHQPPSSSLFLESKDLACHPAAMATCDRPVTIPFARLSSRLAPRPLPSRSPTVPLDSAALARLYALSGQQSLASVAEPSSAEKTGGGGRSAATMTTNLAAETVSAIQALQRAISSDPKRQSTMKSQVQMQMQGGLSRRERVLSWRSQVSPPTTTIIPATC